VLSHLSHSCLLLRICPKTALTLHVLVAGLESNKVPSRSEHHFHAWRTMSSPMSAAERQLSAASQLSGEQSKELQDMLKLFEQAKELVKREAEPELEGELKRRREIIDRLSKVIQSKKFQAKNPTFIPAKEPEEIPEEEEEEEVLLTEEELQKSRAQVYFEQFVRQPKRRMLVLKTRRPTRLTAARNPVFDRRWSFWEEQFGLARCSSACGIRCRVQYCPRFPPPTCQPEQTQPEHTPTQQRCTDARGIAARGTIHPSRPPLQLTWTCDLVSLFAAIPVASVPKGDPPGHLHPHRGRRAARALRRPALRAAAPARRQTAEGAGGGGGGGGGA
jgi:hypothetical protein